MGELSYQVDRTGPVTVVRLAGDLLLRDLPTIRGILMKSLVECPAAVVVDVAELTVARPIKLMVFAAVGQRAASWPGVPLLLAGATGQTAAALGRIGLSRPEPIYRSVADAVAAVEWRAPDLRLRLHLRPTNAAGAQARLLVQDACQRWDLDQIRDAAVLVASELVDNAAAHARTDIVVMVAYRGRYLHLSVEDGVPSPARLRGGDPGADDGVKGLRLVEAFSTAWGTLPAPGGKITWATLKTS